MTDPVARPRPGAQPDPPLGALVHDLTQQVPELIRSEMRLAQAELTQKGKRVGAGVGMFGAAGVVALYAGGAGVATAIIALALVMDAWLAGLVVTVVLLVVAGVLGLTGRSQVGKATPLKPERATEGLKEDIATVKGSRA